MMRLEWKIIDLKQDPRLAPLNHLKFKTLHGYRGFRSCNHQKWLPYQILCGKLAKNVIIDPQTTEMWTKLLNVPWVSE